MTAICHLEGSSHSNGALAFATAHGQINFVLSLSNDLSRSTNRVETFMLKPAQRSAIVAMRGLLLETDSEKENVTKHLYCFLVMTAAGQLHSIQVETGSDQESSPGQSVPPSVEIKAT